MSKVRLIDICQPKQWKTIPTSQLTKEGCPVYGANGKIGFYSEYNHEKETILITCRGATCGSLNISEPFSYVNGNAMCLDNLDDSVLLKYLYYNLCGYNFSKIISGTAQPQITGEGLSKVVLNIHSANEQKIIVDLFEKLEKILISQDLYYQKLDELIKSRFVEMFGDANNSLEYPIISIKDTTDVQVGVVIKPAQYYTNEEDGVRAFRGLNIGEMYIKDDEWVYFSEEGQKKNSKSILRENDIVIVRSGAPGTACVITKQYEGYYAVDIIIARPNIDKVNPYYLCAYTNYPHGRNQIEDGIGGAAQKHFNVSKYKEMKLIYPPIELQNQFADFVIKVEQQKATIQKSINKLETLKKSLMQEYFG